MNGQFRSALALSLAIVLASLIASSAFLKAKRLDQTIKVTGSAKKRIKSDLMVWRTSVSAEAATLAEAYARLTRDVEKTKAFLVAQGFPENNIVISAVATTPIRSSSRAPQRIQAAPEDGGPASSNNRITSYTLTQTLEIRSAEIDKLTAVSRKVTQLINQGILLESNEPEYLYTKLAELKVVMLADAARDARERAAQIASSAGGKVGEMRSAEMGVMQVNAADANEISGYGVNDMKSVEKDVLAVVHATFALD
jgi:uncharacterized protein